MGSVDKLSKKVSKKVSKKSKKDKKDVTPEEISSVIVEAKVKSEDKKKKKKDKKESKKEKKESKKVDKTDSAKLSKEEKKAKKAKKAAKKEAKAAKKRSASESEIAEVEPKKIKEEDNQEKKVEQVKQEAEPELTPRPKGKKGEKPFIPSKAETEGSTRVFLGNCSYNIDDDAVTEAFKACGEIEDIFWLTDKETEKFYGTGFVTFTTVEGANAAAALNGVEICGRSTRIEMTTARKKSLVARPPGGGRPCAPTSEKPEGSCCIFVANLSFDITDEILTDFFKDVGTVVSIRWCENKETGQFKGCGFVEFESTEIVDEAVKLAGQALLSRQVRMDYAS